MSSTRRLDIGEKTILGAEDILSQNHSLRVCLTYHIEKHAYKQRTFVPGNIYSPHIVSMADADRVHWSVRVIVNQSIDENSCYAELAMLAKNVDAQHFFSELKIGSEFILVEGNRITAFGVVTAYSDLSEFEKTWSNSVC